MSKKAQFSFCTSAGHETEPAIGEAIYLDDLDEERPFPYCAECLETLERGGEDVTRWSAM
ncbi:hypothetical protein [Caudovirales GX15bay]|nr:hypothetical protein [Caudovirales GX15bay]